jgi:transcriptional regulator with XRE-family HTH domain
MNTGNGTAAGGSIRLARREAGLTQEQLAARADCSVDYIRLLERGYAPRFSDVVPRVLVALKGGFSPLAVSRRELGMTQEMLALRAGMERELVARLEAGEEEPSRTMKEQLAGALETSVEQIFPRPSDAPSGDQRQR